MNETLKQLLNLLQSINELVGVESAFITEIDGNLFIKIHVGETAALFERVPNELSMEWAAYLMDCAQDILIDIEKA